MPESPWQPAASLLDPPPQGLLVPRMSEDPHSRERTGKKLLSSSSSQCPFLPRADRAAPSPKSLVGEEGREVNNPFAKLPQRTRWKELAEFKGLIWETTQGFQDLTRDDSEDTRTIKDTLAASLLSTSMGTSPGSLPRGPEVDPHTPGLPRTTEVAGHRVQNDSIHPTGPICFKTL